MGKKKSKIKNKNDKFKKDHKARLSRKEYEAELFKLQAQLVKLQYWVIEKGLKIVVLFEGRNAAGKGGVIKRITERVSPRVFRVEALPAPNTTLAGVNHLITKKGSKHRSRIRPKLEFH